MNKVYAYFCNSRVAFGHRAGDFFTRQNVTQRQILVHADRLSQQDKCAVGLTTPVFVRSENATPTFGHAR